jgi:hypothetical protein
LKRPGVPLTLGEASAVLSLGLIASVALGLGGEPVLPKPTQSWSISHGIMAAQAGSGFKYSRKYIKYSTLHEIQ